MLRWLKRHLTNGGVKCRGGGGGERKCCETLGNADFLKKIIKKKSVQWQGKKLMILFYLQASCWSGSWAKTGHSLWDTKWQLCPGLLKYGSQQQVLPRLTTQGSLDPYTVQYRKLDKSKWPLHWRRDGGGAGRIARFLFSLGEYHLYNRLC